MMSTCDLAAIAEAMVRLYQNDDVARDSIYQGYEIRFDDPLGAVDLYEAALERANEAREPSDWELWIVGTHAAEGTGLPELMKICPIAE